MASAWSYARASGRDYLTPEDIGEARESGCPDSELWAEVLWAIADRRCEDAVLSAFVAVKDAEEHRGGGTGARRRKTR